MSPNGKGKVVTFGLRRPAAAPTPPPSEDAIRALEDKAEALGNGTPGAAAKRAPAPVESISRAEGQGSIVQRKGRLRGDGSRTEARTLRRMTIYLPPELAQALELHAVQTGKNKSQVTEAALAQLLGV